MARDKNSKFVYSTHPDSINAADDSLTENSASDIAYIERDRKGRKGKVVTVISGLKGDLKTLQKELQKQCGAGGSVKNNTIEVQGDHRDKIAAILQKKGFKVKLKGG
jgi:translation initiation factor 1